MKKNKCTHIYGLAEIKGDRIFFSNDKIFNEDGNNFLKEKCFYYEFQFCPKCGVALRVSDFKAVCCRWAFYAKQFVVKYLRIIFCPNIIRQYKNNKHSNALKKYSQENKRVTCTGGYWEDGKTNGEKGRLYFLGRHW